MKVTVFAAVAAVMGMATFSTQAAVVVVNDSFDTYADQAAFEAIWTPIASGTPSSAELSTLQASSGAQSVRVPGNAANNLSRNRLTFAETGTTTIANGGKVVWSFDFYDGNGAAAPYRSYANLHDSLAPGATNQLISMGLNNNLTAANSGGNYYMARILGYTPLVVDPDGGPGESGTPAAGAYFKLNDFEVGLRSTGWHNLRVEITSNDGLSTDYYFYVDGQLAEQVLDVGTAASIRSYDNIAIGSAVSNGNIESFFDNMYLEVPEPASLTLAAAGLLFARRRRG